MPNNSLYSLITFQGKSSGQGDPLMGSLFSDTLRASGIYQHVSNAMASVLGGNSTHSWRLWEVKKSPEAPLDDGAGYCADDTPRYFFEYDKESGYGNALMLEYARTDSFELRGARLSKNGHADINVEEPGTREAITAMLLAIMRHEKTNADFIVAATNFKRDYSQKFLRGPTTCFPGIQAIYGYLCDSVDPQKENTTPGFFKAESSFLNQKNGKLKKPLEGERFGYVNGSDNVIHLAAGMKGYVLDGVLHPTATFPPELFAEMPVPLAAPSVPKPLDTAAMQYALSPGRKYDNDEQRRLVEIPDWYIPVPQIQKITAAVHASSRFERPYRNILLRGPAGTGKTEGAKAIASMLGLPYGHVTGHAEAEFFDLTSSLIPRTESDLRAPEELIEYMSHALKEAQLKIPSFSYMSSFPDSAYFDITGAVREDATEQDCLIALSARLLGLVKQDKAMYTGSESKFKIIRSDLVEGLERGWLVEMQELNTIQKPGVLVGLNSILEYGSLTLPAGETIKRHPDAVVVFTQNVGYAGTADTNQSVFSRIELKCDLPHPTEDEMVERIKQHVPGLKAATIRSIVKACADIRDRCAAEIEGGSVGTREAINWAKLTVILGSIKEAAEYTVLPSCSEDPDDIARVRVAVINNLKD